MNKKDPFFHRNIVKHSQIAWGYVFISPCIVGLLVFNFGPMIFSLFMGFTKWDMITPPKIVGMKNYIDIAKDPLVGISLRVTFYYALLSVPLITVTTFIIASLLNTGVKGISVFRTIFYIPSIVPAVASSALWTFIYDPMFGLINSILHSFGVGRINLLYSRTGVIPALSLMAVWGAGNTVVIYLAGLQGISRQLYEAADLDGASPIQKLFRITVPLMTPIIFFNVIMGIIGSMQTFTQAYIMTSGGPDNASLFYTLLIYRTAFNYQNMGYASAMSWLLFIIIATLTIITFKSSNRWVFYENKND
jgi:multiple sugar transport system permease protein